MINDLDPQKNTPEEVEKPHSHRHKHRTQKRDWLHTLLPEGLIILAIGLAMVLSFQARNQPGNTRLLIATAVWSLLVITALIWRVHWRIIHIPKWWDRACPRCQSTDLRRIHRTRLAHFLNSFAIPARNYHCVNCHWEGVRIDESKV